MVAWMRHHWTLYHQHGQSYIIQNYTFCLRMCTWWHVSQNTTLLWIEGTPTFMYTHTPTHTHTHTHTHPHTHTQTHLYTHTYTHPLTHIHTHPHTHTPSHTHTYTHLYTHTYTTILLSFHLVCTLDMTFKLLCINMGKWRL